jgi:hypothetical protein
MTERERKLRVTLQDLRALETREDFGPLVRYRLVGRGDPLPDSIRTECLADGEDPPPDDTHWAMGFHRGRDWLYSAIAETQPLSHAALMAGSDLYLLVSDDRRGVFPGWRPMAWYTEVAGRMVRLNLGEVFQLRTPVPPCALVEKGPREHRKFLDARDFLGDALALAWCSFVKGMDVETMRGRVFNGGYGLPAGAALGRQAIDLILAGVHGAPFHLPAERQRKLAARELALLHDTYGFRREGNWHGRRADRDLGLTRGLRCFIETSPLVDRAAPHDTVLVQTPHDRSMVRRGPDGEPLLYLVRDHRWDDLQVLTDPARAIDAYVAHTLTDPDTRFDFSPWCRPAERASGPDHGHPETGGGWGPALRCASAGMTAVT